MQMSYRRGTATLVESMAMSLSCRRSLRASGLFAGILALGVACASRSEEPDRSTATAEGATFVDQNGAAVSLRRDVLEAGPALVAYMFTSCKKTCPLMGHRLDALSDALSELPEEQRPRIVLVSIDPERDTPAALRTWAARFRNGSRWTLLTGSEKALANAAQLLGGSAPSTDGHSPSLVYVDAKRGVRRVLLGLESTSSLFAEIGAARASIDSPPVPTTMKPLVLLSPQTGGTWDHVTDWNTEVAVHSVLLPTGRVLYWPRYDKTGFNIPTGAAGAETPNATVWDPMLPIGAAGRYTTVANGRTNLFCAGQSLLPDGRVMVIGGHDENAGGSGDLGTVDVNLFDPTTQTWSAAPDMNVERWYGTVTPLANGQMMAIGGAYNGQHADGTPNQSVEIYQPGGWSGFVPMASSANLAKQLVAVRATTGRADAIMLGIDGRMWRSQEQTNGSFPDFANRLVGSWSNLGQRIAAVPMPNGGIDVFMVGLDNALWHTASRADGSFPDFASGRVGSSANRGIDVAVVRKRSGQTSAFMVGMDNHLWRSDQAANGTFPDFALKPVASTSNLATRLAAVLRADDSIELFMIGIDGRMWHSREQPNGTFPDFALGPVGSSSNLATSITAAVGPNGRIRVYMAGLPQNGVVRMWRTDEQSNGSYPEFAEHPVGETELSVRSVSYAPQTDGSGDLYIVNDQTQQLARDRQVAGVWGWNELNLPQTTSNTSGWYIYYPWSFVAPNGSVFVASASTHSYWIDPIAQSLVEGPHRSALRVYGTAVMYAPGKILVAGGSSPTTLASAEVIDLNAPSPAWRAVGAMHYPRQQATTTMLPNGQVLVTNGTQRSGFDPNAAQESPGMAILPSEIWDPVTEQWTEVNASPEARTYHSNALLIPDGRVLVNGGGQGGGGSQPNGAPGVPDHPNADLYSPPYLFQGSRPGITSAPSHITYGSAFQVPSVDAATVTKASLVRLGATTHAFNENQRFAWLTVQSTSGGVVTLAAPSSGNIAPPGHYLLFLMNAQGVPSVGKIVQVGN
jgi:cytochrome oxidase Cu insertion factor (SCO1/SenC/PrrC family)